MKVHLKGSNQRFWMLRSRGRRNMWRKYVGEWMKRETSEEDSRTVILKKNGHRLSDKLHWTQNSNFICCAWKQIPPVKGNKHSHKKDSHSVMRGYKVTTERKQTFLSVSALLWCTIPGLLPVLDKCWLQRSLARLRFPLCRRDGRNSLRRSGAPSVWHRHSSSQGCSCLKPGDGLLSG